MRETTELTDEGREGETRLYLHPAISATRISIVGKLNGRWVDELECCWHTLSGALRGRMEVDVCRMVSADARGERLLAVMRQSGVIIRTGLAMPWWRRAVAVPHLSWLLVLVLLLAGCLPVSAEVVSGRYILELSTAPVAAHVASQGRKVAMKSALAAQYRLQVRAQQTRVKALLPADTSVLDSADTIGNLLFVKGGDATQLAAIPGVLKVHPVRSFHRTLDRAVVVDKVVEAWNQLGSAGAGAGVKIAIIDSGIDAAHAGFQDSSLTVPDGYPVVGQSSDTAYTNNKIIVARSYVKLLSYNDPDYSARDRVGHGTALAMVAAGVTNTGPLATITGIAPKAQLGNYKVFGTPGYNDSSTEDAILKAMDDAVADGMDILNLSLGDDFAPRLADDLSVQAVEAAAKAGILVTVAAGNNGPDLNTIASPATAPSAISVGASRNDRTFAASVAAGDAGTFVAYTGNGTSPSDPVSGTVVDVASLDSTGKACSALASGSLTGKVALILRGDCTFESKLTYALQAGAAGAVVYAAADSPDPVSMSVGTATLPAVMIAYGDGVSIKSQVAAGTEVTATITFTKTAVPLDANHLTTFTVAGPSVDLGIKPDLVAVGQDLYVATQSYDSDGDMYDSTGYTLIDGTSFSAPTAAGVLAVLKSARPGLTVAQYRSLLINSSGTINGTDSSAASVQHSGAGLLNAGASLQATATVSPTSLSFGSGTANPSLSSTLTISNNGTVADTFSIAVTGAEGDTLPAVATNTLQLDPGAAAELAVSLTGTELAGGAHEGYLRISSAANGTEIRVPYWYSVATDTPARVTVLYSLSEGYARMTQTNAIYFRVTDAAGVIVSGIKPAVTVASGSGRVVGSVSYDSSVPGVYGVTLRLSSGTNVFRIAAGTATADVTITGY